MYHRVIGFRAIIDFKTSHFRILYSFPSRISALFLFATETDDAILLATKVAR
jgi:hypothetical protein